MNTSNSLAKPFCFLNFSPARLANSLTASISGANSVTALPNDRVQAICCLGSGAASSGFAESIANAHAAHQRPRCLCTPEGVEMYVARLAGPHGGYIVKRIPDTGCRHACDCPSFEPAADLSGLGQVLGTAINEDPATGQTSLRLGFSLTKLPGRSQMPPAGGESESVCTDGTKLSLRGLLHYLWDQAC